MDNKTLSEVLPPNNTASNQTDCISHAPSITDRRLTQEQIVNISLNTFIFVGGLIGNIFVITVILRRKKMRTITNWFVLNLAISSILIVCLTIPTANIAAYVDWPWGEVGCKYLVAPVMEHFAGVCVLTHTALSIARYITVKNALRGLKLQTRHVVVCVLGIWLIAFIVMSVTLMGPFADFVLVRNPRTCVLTCQLFWKSEHKRLTYRGLIFSLTYVVPMVATGFAYLQIHVTVSASLKTLFSHMSNDGARNRRQKSRRMDRVLMTMYVLFGLSTLPLQLLYAINDFVKLPIQSYGIQLTWLICVAMFYFQVVFNPLVLFYMGEDYRRELYRLPVCCCVVRPRLRRLSHAFSSSFTRSSHKRASTMSGVKNDSARLMNGDRKMSTPKMSLKPSNGSLLLPNSYGGFEYNFSNRDDILQTVDRTPFIDLNEDENSIDYIETDTKSSSDTTIPKGAKFETGITENNGVNLYYTNSSNLSENDKEADGYASSFLYNSDSQKSLNTLEMGKKYSVKSKADNYDVHNNNDDSQSKYGKFLSVSEQDSPNLQTASVNDLFKINDSVEESSSQQKKSSSDSLTAYYDDGSIHYIYDVNFGMICFEDDDGKETII